jgi:hypothetical protein
MTFYSFASFLHIVGALGLFIALGLEWTSLWSLRRATIVEQVRVWLSVFGWLGRIHAVSGAAILLPGIYMTATVWGGVAWIIVALVAMVLMVILGPPLTGRRMAAIGPVLAAERGSVTSAALRQRLADTLLWASIQTRLAIALGIVFLMTVKPGLGGALLTIGVAIVVGLALAWPTRGRREIATLRQAQDATSGVSRTSEAQEKH